MPKPIHIDEPNSNEPLIHFRRHPKERAPCGAESGKQWTDVPAYVTCAACRAWLERWR